MKVGVIGASGLIGRYVYNEFQKKYPTLGTSQSKDEFFTLSIEDKTSISKFLLKHKPAIVVICAALSFVDYCETHPDESYNINVLGVIYICDILKKNLPQTQLIFLSSDYVFNGVNGPYKETHTRHPINIYGIHKMKAEKYIQKSISHYLIIRTNWVYGAEKSKKNFVYSIKKSLENKEQKILASDQIANPTYAGDIANAIVLLSEKRKIGIFHIAGPDYVSRFKFAKKIAGAYNLNSKYLVKKTTKNIKQLAKRPLKSGLKTKKVTDTTEITFIGITEGLKKLQEDEKTMYSIHTHQE